MQPSFTIYKKKTRQKNEEFLSFHEQNEFVSFHKLFFQQSHLYREELRLRRPKGACRKKKQPSNVKEHHDLGGGGDFNF